MVGQYTRDIAAMVTGTRHKPLRHRLIVAGGQAAALGAWLCFDLGDTAAAYRYWDSALVASRFAANSQRFETGEHVCRASQRGGQATLTQGMQIAHTAGERSAHGDQLTADISDHLLVGAGAPMLA